MKGDFDVCCFIPVSGLDPNQYSNKLDGLP